MEKRLELRLAKILRHVHLKDTLNINILADKMARAQGLSLEMSLAYIWELIADDYLEYKSDATVSRGSTPYPPEIAPGGYYCFESECWSCGQIRTRNLDIYTSRIHWECTDCQVKWTEDVLS